MTINRTTLLDLPLPVTGTESGTWGDVTNNGLSQYVDIAVAGMNALTSSDFTAGALTISNTQGDSGGTNIAAGSAQYATIKVSSLAQNSTITAPASNRSYRIVNLDSTYNLTIKASGQTGITFLPGQTGVVAFTGTDYEVVGVVNAASSTDNAVPKFDGTTGQIIQNTGVTIDDSNNVSGVAQLNATTADLTNIEVTNIKAKDGTSAGSIADSTGVVTLASSVLTTTDINGGTIDGAVIGGASAAAGSFTTLNTSGQVVFNDAGADVDFRVEGDTDANLLFVDASTDRVGIGTNTPSYTLDITNSASGLRLGSDVAGYRFFREATGGDAGLLQFYGSQSGYTGYIFDSVDGERVRIDTSGNVGIGTSSPLTNLHVRVNALSGYTSVANSGLLIERGNGPAALNIASPNTESGFIWFADQDSASVGNIAYNHASNFMSFQTNGSERARIDSSGNLGLGTTTAVTKATVYGSGDQKLSLVSPTGSSTQVGINLSPSMTDAEAAANPAQAAIYATDSSYSANIIFANKATGAVGNALTERMRIDSSGNVGIGTSSPDSSTFFGKVLHLSDSSNCGMMFERTSSTAGKFSIGLNTSLNFLFAAGGTERMRIDSSGNLLVGTSSGDPDSGIGNKTTPGGQRFSVMAGSTNDNITYTLYSTGASAYRFYVGLAGTVFATNTSISAISDVRHKENIRDLDVGLAEVMQLQPRVFDWKEGKGKGTQNDRGFIAQEFEQVFPDLIDEWKDPAPEGEEPYKSVRQDLIPVLVKAIQELKAELDTVKAELATLKGN
jgi:hypothetical protein